MAPAPGKVPYLARSDENPAVCHKTFREEGRFPRAHPWARGSLGNCHPRDGELATNSRDGAQLASSKASLCVLT